MSLFRRAGRHPGSAGDPDGGRTEAREVRAAGGVVWRRRDGQVEVLLVHRPKYDDWSLPKGKAERGESDEETAAREVEEETGLRCAVGELIDTVRYRDQKDRPKVVRYYAMQPADGTGAGARPPGHEVDELRWAALHEVPAVVTQERDARTVERLPTAAG